MKVIWRQKGKDWDIASGRSYDDEAHLQAFLAENPSLIPFDDVSKDILPPRVMIREVGLPGSGITDIVGVDETGGITIIECKLATNPEVKRKVIGQVLEYAAFLWKRPYKFLDDRCLLRLEKSLADAMRESADEESLDAWDQQEFVQSVTETLFSGAFRIVVAVDAVNDELRRTIEYLAEGPSALEVFALELTYFGSDESEILVPHLYGRLPSSDRQAAGVRRAVKQWTAERFFADASHRKVSDSVINRMRDLLSFAEHRAGRVYWGTGKETGSFTFHYFVDGQVLSMFSVRSDGKLQMNFGWLKDKIGVAKSAEYWNALKPIGGFSKLNVRSDFHCWPSIDLAEAFDSQEDLDAFKATVEDMEGAQLVTG